MTTAIRKGAELELEVDKLAFGGKALARVDDFVVFIDHALPGQQVRVRIDRKRRQYAEARCLAVLAPAPHQQEAFCPHFGPCGGCSWQDLAYDQQLYWKRVQVQECLQHLADCRLVEVRPTLAAPETIYYRNKMEFSFSDRLWLPYPPGAFGPAGGREIDLNLGDDDGETDGPGDGETRRPGDEGAARSPRPRVPASPRHNARALEGARPPVFALGLHARGAYDKIINVETCFLESPQAVGILKAVRASSEKSGLTPYTTRTHQGFWRFLVVREGKHTGQTLVHIVTAAHPDQDRVVRDLAGDLLQRFPSISSVIHSVSRKKAQVAIGDEIRTVIGPAHIEEGLATLRFRISAHSFFQTNTLGAERLYDAVLQAAGFTGGETVWDLYCGTGSIALYIARQVRGVLGFEVIAEAITDARVNAAINGIDNCSFQLGDINELAKDPTAMVAAGGVPDVVISDPPRAGMHPRVVQALLQVAPAKIVAVSCNPSTLARDLAMLLPSYQITSIQPVDLFPHTPHIECVVALEKRRG